MASDVSHCLLLLPLLELGLSNCTLWDGDLVVDKHEASKQNSCEQWWAAPSLLSDTTGTDLPLEQRLWDEGDEEDDSDFGEIFILEQSGLIFLLLLVLKYCMDDDSVSDFLLSVVQESIDESLRHFEIPSAAAAAATATASLQFDANGMVVNLGRWYTTTFSVSTVV